MENVLQGTIADWNDPRELVAVVCQLPLGLTRVRQLLMCATYTHPKFRLTLKGHYAYDQLATIQSDRCC